MSDTNAFERCISGGGVAIFPADTVYGLACSASDAAAVERLYTLKRRPLEKPSAVMFFDLEAALESMPELGEATRAAMARLLPGPVSLLVPNPSGRFPLACGADPGTLGVRVPAVPQLSGVRLPVLQSSANDSGGVDPRRLADVPARIRSAVDLVIDGGELPGVASTVVDLRRYEEDGTWTVARAGAVGEEELGRALASQPPRGPVVQFHFHPKTYDDEIHADIPAYDELQRELVDATGSDVRRILELGTGTGTTAQRLLDRHPDAMLVGIDASAGMLAAARERLDGERVELIVGQLEAELPHGPFDLVASALAVHHLDPGQKAHLFERVRAVLAPGGRFVLADVVVPEDPADVHIDLTPGFDKPSSVPEQLRWLAAAGFDANLSWGRGDLAVIVADA